MGRMANSGAANGRGAGFGLALLALLVTILVPPGYMTAAGQGGPSLVICTGHGPLSFAASDLNGSHKAPKARPDNPCAFAGHGIAEAGGPAPALSAPTYFIHPTIQSVRADLTPGRGLAAPPPPSQAPPVLL